MFHICIYFSTVCIAAAFPNLELVISFVGSIFFSTLGLLFPVIAETVYQWDRGLGKFNCVLWKNIFIGVVSIIAMVTGALTSVQGMIEDFGSHGTKEHDMVNQTAF